MIQLFNGDCLEAMKKMKDDAFELAICDPPYGIGISNSNKLTGSSKKEYKIKDWDNQIPSQEYFKELKRVSKNQIIWGANYFGIKGGGIVWNKLGKQIGRRNPMPSMGHCEFAYCSFHNSIKMFSYTYIGNVIGNDYKVEWESERIHPTQKPVALYTWLLEKYAKQGDKILDTHLGSGSIAIACHNLGFDLVGYELDEEYYQAAKKRLEEHQKQLRLF